MNKQEAIKKLFFDEYSIFGEIEVIRINTETNVIKARIGRSKAKIKLEIKYYENDVLNMMEGKE